MTMLRIHRRHPCQKLSLFRSSRYLLMMRLKLSFTLILLVCAFLLSANDLQANGSQKPDQLSNNEPSPSTLNHQQSQPSEQSKSPSQLPPASPESSSGIVNCPCPPQKETAPDRNSYQPYIDWFWQPAWADWAMVNETGNYRETSFFRKYDGTRFVPIDNPNYEYED